MIHFRHSPRRGSVSLVTQAKNGSKINTIFGLNGQSNRSPAWPLSSPPPTPRGSGDKNQSHQSHPLSMGSDAPCSKIPQPTTLLLRKKAAFVGRFSRLEAFELPTLRVDFGVWSAFASLPPSSAHYTQLGEPDYNIHGPVTDNDDHDRCCLGPATEALGAQDTNCLVFCVHCVCVCL